MRVGDHRARDEASERTSIDVTKTEELARAAASIVAFDLGSEGALLPRLQPSRFSRRALSPEDVAVVVGDRDPRATYDAYRYRRYPAWLDQTFPTPDGSAGTWSMRTNSVGLREDEDVRKTKPDLRVLVTGDSHSDGVCDNADSFTNVLEALLREDRPGQVVEALNASRGGYSFYEYLGTLENFLAFEPDVFVVGVYGGNDFFDVLAFEHFFRRTPRPQEAERVWPAIERAIRVSSQAVAQAFLSIAEFNAMPQEVELALQAARDVSTEIVATCRRHGIHPVFVYIPPLCDVHPRAVAEEIERLRAALELEPQQLLVLDRMAEVYLTHLRSLRVDVIDLRPAFRAVEHQLYWPDDWHIDVRGHRTIAEALRPLVNAARPAAAQRVAAAARAPARSRTLLSPGAPDELLLARASAVPDRGVALDLPSHVEDLPPVRPLGQPSARALYPFGDELEFDALAGSRVPAGLDLWVACAEHPEGGWRVQTNSRGLRSKRECAAARPAFRAVFTGDGRTLTACAESEAWPALVERELARLHPGSALECWNATAPGATLQQQLGTLKRLSDLTPDLLVVALDGDDDLLATLRVARVAATLRKKRARDAGPAPESVSSQGNAAALTTLAHFRDVPADTAVAVHTAVGTTLEIQELCRSSGARLLVLYVPSAIDVEWSDVAPEVAREAERLQLTRAGLHAMDQLATQYLGELRKRGIDVFDCRRVLRDAPYPCYWRTRSGLNLAGQRVVARGVQPALERAFDARRR